MTMLVGLSRNLFIIPSTASYFILDRKHIVSAERIAKLLDGISPQDFSGSKHTSIMDNRYTRILHAARPDSIDGWIDSFQAFVGAIVILRAPRSSPVRDIGAAACCRCERDYPHIFKCARFSRPVKKTRLPRSSQIIF